MTQHAQHSTDHQLGFQRLQLPLGSPYGPTGFELLQNPVYICSQFQRSAAYTYIYVRLSTYLSTTKTLYACISGHVHVFT